MIYCFQIAIFLLLMTIESLENESDTQPIDIKNDKEHSTETPVNLEPINEKIEKHTNHFYINNSTVNINIYGKMDDSNQSFRNENIGNLTQCKPIQQVCIGDFECCSQSCAPNTGTFYPQFCTKCKPANAICQNDEHCCSKKCIRNIIFLLNCAPCFDIGKNCDASSKCCSSYCKLNAKPKPVCSKAPILLDDYIKENGLLGRVNDNDTSETQQQNGDEDIQCSVVDDDEFNKNQRSGIDGELYRWRTGLFITFTTNFSIPQLQIITKGLTILNNLLKKCIPIYVWPTGSIPTDKYVIIRKGLPGTGCNTNVGKQKYTPQFLNLQENGCITEGTVVHETMHALGIYHEQSRPDRDKHVTINFKNIDFENHTINFRRQDTSLIFNTKYNTKSIMHYESTAFGRFVNGEQLNTIVKKNGDKIIRSNIMANTDKQKLLAMYCKK